MNLKNKMLVITLALALEPMAMAQSGHTLNSVDTTPGTTAPIAPTDPIRPVKKPDNGAVTLPINRSELDKDAGSSKADRKASRKKQPVQQEQRLGPDFNLDGPAAPETH